MSNLLGGGGILGAVAPLCLGGGGGFGLVAKVNPGGVFIMTCRATLFYLPKNVLT